MMLKKANAQKTQFKVGDVVKIIQGEYEGEIGVVIGYSNVSSTRQLYNIHFGKNYIWHFAWQLKTIPYQRNKKIADAAKGRKNYGWCEDTGISKEFCECDVCLFQDIDIPTNLKRVGDILTVGEGLINVDKAWNMQLPFTLITLTIIITYYLFHLI